MTTPSTDYVRRVITNRHSVQSLRKLGRQALTDDLRSDTIIAPSFMIAPVLPRSGSQWLPANDVGPIADTRECNDPSGVPITMLSTADLDAAGSPSLAATRCTFHGCSNALTVVDCTYCLRRLRSRAALKRWLETCGAASISCRRRVTRSATSASKRSSIANRRMLELVPDTRMRIQSSLSEAKLTSPSDQSAATPCVKRRSTATADRQRKSDR